MICATDVEEFIPYGRQHSTYHPGYGRRQNRIGSLLDGFNEQGITLHKALKEFSIKESGKVNEYHKLSVWIPCFALIINLFIS